MVTTRLQVPSYIKEYMENMYGKMISGRCVVVLEARRTDLFLLFADALQKRPSNISPIDRGNLEVYIPNIRLVGSVKDSRYYNFIPEIRKEPIVRRMELMFKIDLYTYMEERKYEHGEHFQEAMYSWLDQKGVRSFNEESGIRMFRRWRDSGGYVKAKNKVSNSNSQNSLWTISEE